MGLSPAVGDLESDMPTFPVPPESAFLQEDPSKHPLADKAERERATADLRKRLGDALVFTFTPELVEGVVDPVFPDLVSIEVKTKVAITGPNGPVALDRPEMMGYGLRSKNSRLAQRLMKAISAGVVFPNPRVCLDIDGHTYVDAGWPVSGRTMGADLKRLGF